MVAFMQLYSSFAEDSLDKYCAQLINRRPLVHCMTNDVVQEITANVLLACGASPAMVIAEEESAQFSSIADALLINVGTLTSERYIAMKQACEVAHTCQKPWVLDPVAIGPMTWRNNCIIELMKYSPSVIRGNASEIICLAGSGSGGHGVDSINGSDEAINAAQMLASHTGAIVAVTGEADFITDGHRTVTVNGGHIMATRVVGTGCSLGALVAAFITLDSNTLDACAAAHALFKRSEEFAVAHAQGPGSFHSAFLDALYQISHRKQNDQ